MTKRLTTVLLLFSLMGCENPTQPEESELSIILVKTSDESSGLKKGTFKIINGTDDTFEFLV